MASSTFSSLKIEESENRVKYLDFARELKKLWNMRVTVILIVISTLDPPPKGLLRRLIELAIGDHIDTIDQNTEQSPGDPKRLQ